MKVAQEFGGTPYDHLHGGVWRLLYNYSMACSIEIGRAKSELRQLRNMKDADPADIFDTKRRIRFLTIETECYG